MVISQNGTRFRRSRASKDRRRDLSSQYEGSQAQATIEGDGVETRPSLEDGAGPSSQPPSETFGLGGTSTVRNGYEPPPLTHTQVAYRGAFHGRAEDDAGPSNISHHRTGGAVEVARVRCEPYEMEEAMMKINRLELRAVGEQSRFLEAGLSPHTMEGVVRAVVRHVIFANTAHPNVPIPHEELSKVIASRSQGSKNQKGWSRCIIAMAQHSLAARFGMELVEILKRRREGDEIRKYYALRSLIPQKLYNAIVPDREEDEKLGLLAAVLGLITVSGGKISEGELWRHLNDLGVSQTIPHPVLGHPANLVEEYCRQRRLRFEKEDGADGPQRIFYIGENCLDELGEEQIKAFVDDVLQRTIENDGFPSNGDDPIVLADDSDEG